MSTFMPGGSSPAHRRAAMQAAVYNNRKRRLARIDAANAVDPTGGAAPPAGKLYTLSADQSTYLLGPDGDLLLVGA